MAVEIDVVVAVPVDVPVAVEVDGDDPVEVPVSGLTGFFLHAERMANEAKNKNIMKFERFVMG
jgi:hypothetical protein